jgi:hypothetical protein
MSATVAVFQPAGTPFNGVDNTQKIERVYFTVTPAGNYAGAPGDTLDFTALGDLIKSDYGPIFVSIESQKTSGASGYVYQYNPDANKTISGGKFQVLQCAAAGNPLADIGAAAYPAGVTGDTIVGYADFLRV